MFIAPSGGAKAGRVAETACTVQIGDTSTIHGSRAVIGFQSTYPEINRTLLRLRDERSAYAESVKGAIASQARNSLDRQIDLESLSEYLKWRFPDREESPRRDVAELLNELHNLGCRTLKEVDEPVSRAEHALEAFESAYPPIDESTGERGPYAPVGAVRVALSFVRIADGRLGARSDWEKKYDEFTHLLRPLKTRANGIQGARIDTI